MADWPPRTEPRAGHAIALPDVDLASLPRGHVLLGADAPRELVLDAEALETPESIRRWVEGAYAYWLGDGSRGAPLGALGVRLLDELLAPTWALHRLVRGRIEDDRADLLAASREQALIVSRTRTLRRLEVVGPAGSGKSMLAAEKARRLAREGYRTLLVCFNQRLATSLIRELEDAPAPAGLDVTTFHRLCERLGTEAGVLPARPDPIPQGWWDETLPGALEAAIDALPGPALPRGRRRRGPGLRGPLVRAPAAPARRPRRRLLGLPRPGPGAHPDRRRGRARPRAPRALREPPQPGVDRRARRPLLPRRRGGLRAPGDRAAAHA